MSDSPYIVEVTSANFESVILQGSMERPILIDFWADWCEPCKTLIPILEKLADEYQGGFILAKVDTDAEQMIAGLACVAAGNYDDARQCLGILKEDDGKKPEAAKLRGLLTLSDADDESRDEAALAAALDADKGDSEAAYLLGIKQALKGEFETSVNGLLLLWCGSFPSRHPTPRGDAVRW